MLRKLTVVSALAALPVFAAAGVTYQGWPGPGNGKYIVLLAGDGGEYHSEEALPALAKILAVHYGFKCTVLFSINPDYGTIDPRATHN
ncbi:MAG: ThuA domain-containing protein, partial [Bryobacteraceae bacterium]